MFKWIKKLFKKEYKLTNKNKYNFEITIYFKIPDRIEGIGKYKCHFYNWGVKNYDLCIYCDDIYINMQTAIKVKIKRFNNISNKISILTYKDLENIKEINDDEKKRTDYYNEYIDSFINELIEKEDEYFLLDENNNFYKNELDKCL